MTPHPLYRAPGSDGTDRQAAYRELFRCELEAGVVDAIRHATNGNFALGDEHFGDQVAQALGRRVQPGTSGRPRKTPEPESVGLFCDGKTVACSLFPWCRIFLHRSAQKIISH